MLEAADQPSSVIREAVLVHAELVGRLEAEALRWYGAFDGHGLAAADGSRTTAVWIASRTELSRPHAGAMVKNARGLRGAPHVSEAYKNGTIGTAKMRMLLAAREVYPELFGEHEKELVHHISGLTVTHAKVAIERWRQLAESTKAFEDAKGSDGSSGDGGAGGDGDLGGSDPAESNSLRMSSTFQGRWSGEFDLDPIAGSELEAAISAEVDARFGDGSYRADDGISSARRRADSLVELVRRGRREGATSHGDPRPSVGVRIDPATLGGIPAATLGEGLERDCCLDDGTPVDARSIERLLCTCRLQGVWTRLLESGEVETLGITDLLRDATRAQRRALKNRDGRCIFPGCDAAAEWCDVHHVIPAEDLGPTLLENMVLVCRTHHHMVHEGGWRLWKAPETGRLHLVDPQKRQHPLVAHGQLLPTGEMEPPPPIPPPLRPPRFKRGPEPPGGGSGTGANTGTRSSSPSSKQLVMV